MLTIEAEITNEDLTLEVWHGTLKVTHYDDVYLMDVRATSELVIITLDNTESRHNWPSENVGGDVLSAFAIAAMERVHNANNMSAEPIRSIA